MKAAVISQYQDTKDLTVTEIEKPKIKQNEVLVKVYASSVNPLDWKIAEGEMKRFISISFPFVLGHDIAGIVEEIGESVTRFKVGDAVYALLDSRKCGGYAEYAAVDESFLAKKPKEISMEEAAALPLNSLASLEALLTKGKIKQGDDILINGASGGVGTIAVQLANALGANEVTGVCTQANAELVKKLGADHVIDYQKTDFTKQKEIYEIVFDTVGTASFFSTRSVLEPRGKYVSTLVSPANMLIGFLTSIFSKRQCKYINTRPSGKNLEFISTLVEQGRIRPHIHKVFSLSQIAQALELSKSGKVIGKIVIKVV